MRNDNFIVITTINEKTEGVKSFESLAGWHIIVVGDLKTPPMKDTESLTFLSIEKQLQLNFESANLLPCNHYARKNIGYLYAISEGAKHIYDTDDDNLPYRDWAFPSFDCNNSYGKGRSFVNIYKYFTKEHIWPRGFPLDHILDDDQIVNTTRSGAKKIGVWQGLADNDPDVDAIYRLVSGKYLTFDKNAPVYLGKKSYCPFNSQNTLWNEKAFPWLYLPSKVSFRFTDILRGYIAQRLLWVQGLRLGFTAPTVYQNRNAHNILDDFRDEISCYLNVRDVIDLLEEFTCDHSEVSLILDIYKLLSSKNIVGDGEIEILEAWLEDFHQVKAKQRMNHG